MGRQRKDASARQAATTDLQGPAGQLDLGLLRETITGLLGELGPRVTTPVAVRDARVDDGGRIVCDVDVCWLVPLEGTAPDDAAGSTATAERDICVPAPTDGQVCLGPAGDLVSADVRPPGSDAQREVRAWAGQLIATGAVRGVPREAPAFGPPPRPTHELHAEAGCRQVLRRIGYSA
ncbi:MAG: hypothetical protein ABWZ82_05340 [Candidatus Limnocylindrales bacterium]